MRRSHLVVLVVWVLVSEVPLGEEVGPLVGVAVSRLVVVVLTPVTKIPLWEEIVCLVTMRG